MRNNVNFSATLHQDIREIKNFTDLFNERTPFIVINNDNQWSLYYTAHRNKLFVLIQQGWPQHGSRTSLVCITQDTINNIGV